MTDRLNRALAHIEEMPPTMQDELARLVEDYLQLPSPEHDPIVPGMRTDEPDIEEMLDYIAKSRRQGQASPPLVGI
jgi:hypothetical protein